VRGSIGCHRMSAAPRPARPAWAGPLGLHHPGDTVLHRASPGAKLLGLALVGVLAVTVPGVPAAIATCALVGALAALGRLPLRATARSVAPIALTAALVGAYQWWARGWQVGIEVGLDLVTVVLAATVLTSTTRADVMLDALVRVARPLRHVGIAPETFALAVALMLRTIPALVEAFAEARDAARARGLDRDPRALLVPAAVRTVARARATGDALAARGIGE